MGEFSVTNPDDPSHASSKRTIKGESCTEVCDALALFAAMSVDPEVPQAPLPAAQPTPTALAPAPELRRERKRRAAPDPHAQRSSTRTSALVGLHLGAMSAGVARSLLLVEPFVELGLRQAEEARGLLAAPALRLGFSSTGADTARTADGLAHLHWTTLRLDGCPLEIRSGTAFSVRPCLSASGGLLSATGIIAHPGAQRLLWSTLGGLIRAEWSFLTVLVLEADAGLDVPLRRDRLYFEPATPVYRAPSVMARASLGVGLHFQ
jgi:hypothetical protein